MQALEHDKSNDLMFWASSYNLFVTWSVNGQHPWDNVPNASKPAATLEIGSLRGTNKVAPVHMLLVRVNSIGPSSDCLFARVW